MKRSLCGNFFVHMIILILYFILSIVCGFYCVGLLVLFIVMWNKTKSCVLRRRLSSTSPGVPGLRSAETVGVRPGRPVVVYVRREAARRGVGVMELVSALSALRHREFCDVTAGDPRRLFTTHSAGGLWSLQFARSTEIDIGVYHLELTCWPVGNVSALAAAQPFSFIVDVHVH